MWVKNRLTQAAVLTLCSVATSACSPGVRGGDAAPMFTDDHGAFTVPASSPLRSHLRVEAVGDESSTRVLDLPATVEADPTRVTNVLAPLTGRIIGLKVTLGQKVRRGDVVAVIQSGDYAQARSDAQKARDALDLAQKALVRSRGVLEAGGAADKDLEGAQSAYVQAKAEHDRASARLLTLTGSAEGSSANLIVRAPQTGTVTALNAARGTQVNDATAALMTVTNLDRVFITANVAEKDLNRVRIGSDAAVILLADPERPLHAKISEANAALDPDTRRRKVRLSLANDAQRLLPNMYATVRIAAPARAAVVVPQSALLMNNDAVTVFVETTPWVFRRRAVRLGDETEASAEVLSGLKAGDRVIVRGGVLLDD